MVDRGSTFVHLSSGREDGWSRIGPLDERGDGLWDGLDDLRDEDGLGGDDLYCVAR